jgi:hypothetical protein
MSGRDCSVLIGWFVEEHDQLTFIEESFGQCKDFVDRFRPNMAFDADGKVYVIGEMWKDFQASVYTRSRKHAGIVEVRSDEVRRHY